MGEHSSILFVDIGGDLHTQGIPSQIRKIFNAHRIGAITSIKPGFKNDFDFLLRYDQIMSPDFFESLHFGGLSNNVYRLVKNHEIAALRMMDRLPQFQHGFEGNITERRKLFFQLSDYLYQFIVDNQVKRVIFGNIPHEVYDFILYAICKSLNIPTLIFNDVGGVVKNSLTICESIESLGDLDFGYQTKSQILTKSTPSWYNQVFNDFYRKSNELQAKSTVGRSIISRLSYDLPVTRRRLRLLVSKREHQKHAEKMLPSDPYILLALHVQPELSTSPCGEHYVEQLEAIRLLSNTFKNYRILVREHPDQFRLRIPRPKGFYKELAKVPQVSVSSYSLNIKDVISNSKAVATVSGTIALEAVLLGRPGLIFGYAWFQNCPGIVKISDFDQNCSANTIIENWAAPSQQILNSYIEKLTNSIFQGNTWGSPTGINRHESEEFHEISETNISNIIIHWLKRIY